MGERLNRREFMSLMGILPLSYAISWAPSKRKGRKVVSSQNILIIVFDAFSGHNVSLYGYPRLTTPFLSSLAENAIVYHNHYAAANFTTPGTASLLTGTYPWTHRAIQINSAVALPLQENNIYRLFEDYYTVTYSHNQLVNILQNGFTVDIDHYKPREALILGQNDWLAKLFRKDEDIATVAWARTSGKVEDNLSSTLFLADIFRYFSERRDQRMENEFPIGLPVSSLDHFLLEDAVNWLIAEVKMFPQPFLGYFHFLPPHAPYNTRKQFVNAFQKSEISIYNKPKHPLARPGRVKQEYSLDHYRRTYDEYILYVDSEFNRLCKALEREGVLENTCIVLTSDHGEMFERGILGHSTPSLHDPLVRIPLLIFDPSQKGRKDIYSYTSAVDLLPTLLNLTGKKIPSWIEGSILPPYEESDLERSIFALDAKTNKPSRPLQSASAMILKDQYKLTKYYGYGFLPGGDTLVELYDLKSDPEEMNNLTESHPQVMLNLLDELEIRINAAEEAFRKTQ